MSRFGSVAFASALLALAAAGACGGATTRGGSETNWFVTCHEDSDCTAGVCACGLCTDVCLREEDCGGNGTMRCVREGSATHDRLCLTSNTAHTGLCLAACFLDMDCLANETCEEGACAPRASWKGVHPLAAATGAPCLPSQLEDPTFEGYLAGERILYTDFEGCESARCYVENFQGRPGCPYGSPCETTGEDPEPVTVNVSPQLVSRAPVDTFTCTCRCDGPPGTGPFCACPEGLECRPAVGVIGPRVPDSGSYCLKPGTFVEDPVALMDAERCDRTRRNCEGR